MAEAEPFWQAVLLCRCPLCLVGELYSKDEALILRPCCSYRGLGFAEIDAVGRTVSMMSLFVDVVFIVGFGLVGLALDVPVWLFILLVVIIKGVVKIPLIRLIKAALFARQFRQCAAEMEL